MSKIKLNGKKIRLYYHTDMDGTVSTILIKLFSGANILEFIPCPYQNYPKKDSITGVLDVFVDCRSKERDEDIRIDHHGSGESKEYLSKKGIIVDTRYDSAVRLVADVLGLSIDKTILRQMDKADSGRMHAFFDFKIKDDTYFNMLKYASIDDFKNWEYFENFVLGYMGEGIHVEKKVDKTKKEKWIKEKYGVDIIEIKKTARSPLTKIFYTPYKDGHLLFPKLYKSMTKSDFFKDINSYIKRYYHEMTGHCHMAIYVVVGYLSPKNWKGEDNPEPYEIFVSRSHFNANINIGQIIQHAKIVSKIPNGGGRSDVGGLNTDDVKKAKKALKYIFEVIERNCR